MLLRIMGTSDALGALDHALDDAARETVSVGRQFLGNLEGIFDYLRENGGNILWDLLAVALILLGARGALWLVSRMTRHVMDNPRRHRSAEQGKRLNTLMTLLRSVARYGIYFLSILLILNQFHLGEPVNSLLVATGIGGLAIGFGAQNLVKDVVTGFFMMFENQFSVGDYIKLDDVEGTVEATAMRVTYLRSLKGDQIIVPNGSISRVVNYSRGGYVASITVSTAYEADTRQVVGVIEEAVREYAASRPDLIVEPPVVLGVTAFGASSVDIGVSCRVKAMKQWEVERGMRLAVKERFDRDGIEFPYAHLSVVPDAPSPAKTGGTDAPPPMQPGAGAPDPPLDGGEPVPDWANAGETGSDD